MWSRKGDGGEGRERKTINKIKQSLKQHIQLLQHFLCIFYLTFQIFESTLQGMERWIRG